MQQLNNGKEENKTEFSEEERQKITTHSIPEVDKIDIAKQMLEYQKKQHEDIVANVSHIREVCNYIITAVLIFTGFVVSNKDYLQPIFQKIIFYPLLGVIILFWVWINESFSISLGLIPKSVVDILNSNINTLDLYKKLLKKLEEEYKYTNGGMKFIQIRKRILLILSLIFFVISILFINLPNLSITF